MSFQAARPLDPWRWLGVPALLCVVATVLFAIPLRVFTLGLPEPVFPLVCAFAWAVIRPSLLAPFFLLLLGLFLDVFWGGPLGMWALALVAVYGVSVGMRALMSGQGWLMTAAWYAGMTLLALGVGYLITLIIARQAPSLFGVLWQYLATLALFPLAYRMIDRFEDADVRFR